MYLLCIKVLKDEGLTIVTDLGDATVTGRVTAGVDEPRLNSGKDSMGRRMEALMPLVSLPVADSILGYVSATVTTSMRALANDTPLSIDRVQAARLYAGMLEVGHARSGGPLLRVIALVVNAASPAVTSACPEHVPCLLPCGSCNQTPATSAPARNPAVWLL
jgi:hypothetical protein